jgi:hypothetical protein
MPESRSQEETMGHIDPATGRNKRERGKLQKRVNQGSKGGGIRMSAGKPAESRAAWRRRQKTGRG